MFRLSLQRDPPPFAATLDRRPDARAHRPATRVEDLPDELWLDIFEVNLWRDLAAPSRNGAAALSRLNGRLNAVFAQPLAATHVMQALADAGDGAAFASALAGLDSAPPQYLGACWQAGWDNLRDRIGAPGGMHLSDDLTRLLDRMPPSGAVWPPPWQQVAAFLLDRGRPMRTCEITVRLLEAALRSPCLTAENWRTVVELVGQAGRTGLARRADMTVGAFRAACQTIPGLAARQRADIDLMLDCAWHGYRPDGDTQRWLVERIETTASPDCRWPMSRLLLQGLPLVRSQQDLGPAQILRDLMLRLPMRGRDRVEALSALPRFPPPRERQTELLELTAPLPEHDGLRVLGRQCGPFGLEEVHPSGTPPPAASEGRRLFLARFSDAIDRSRGQPHRHAAMVRRTASIASQMLYPGLRNPLAAMVLEECPRLPPRDRLAVLADLEPRTALGSPWQVQWDRAVRQARSGVHTLTPVAARSLAGVFLKRLWVLDGRVAALQLFYSAMQRLSPEDLAPALQRIAHWRVVKGEPCTSADFDPLLSLCARLPFALRPRPLAALERLAALAPPSCGRRLLRLEQASAVSRQRWDATPPSPDPGSAACADAGSPLNDSPH